MPLSPDHERVVREYCAAHDRYMEALKEMRSKVKFIIDDAGVAHGASRLTLARMMGFSENYLAVIRCHPEKAPPFRLRQFGALING